MKAVILKPPSTSATNFDNVVSSVNKKPESTAGQKWLVSQQLWNELEPLLPLVPDHDLLLGGRPRVSARDAMSGVFFVLKTGCQWKALDATSICSGSTAHKRFEEWVNAGVFHAFWKRGLERYDNEIGIDCEVAVVGRSPS